MYSVFRLLTLVLTFSLAQVAVASDSFDWASPYLGISAGSRSVDADWTTTRYQNPAGATIPFVGSPNGSLNDADHTINAFSGYNWMMAPKVIVGIDGAIGYADNEDSQITIPGVLSATSFISMETSWNGNLRGRLGYLITPRFQVYGAGGLAVAEVEASLVCPADTLVCNPAFGTQSNSESETMLGWTLGAGIEAALTDNLFTRIEYNYADYGTMDFDVFPPNPILTFGIGSEVEYTSQTFSFGIGYKF